VTTREVRQPSAKAAARAQQEAERAAELERLERLLGRAGTTWTRLLAQLHECQAELGALVDARVAGQWTNREHTAYLRLRKTEYRLERRIRRARAVFDRVRVRRRDLERPL